MELSIIMTQRQAKYLDSELVISWNYVWFCDSRKALYLVCWAKNYRITIFWSVIVICRHPLFATSVAKSMLHSDDNIHHKFSLKVVCSVNIADPYIAKSWFFGFGVTPGVDRDKNCCKKRLWQGKVATQHLFTSEILPKARQTRGWALPIIVTSLSRITSS